MIERLRICQRLRLHTLLAVGISLLVGVAARAQTYRDPDGLLEAERPAGWSVSMDAGPPVSWQFKGERVWVVIGMNVTTDSARDAAHVEAARWRLEPGAEVEGPRVGLLNDNGLSGYIVLTLVETNGVRIGSTIFWGKAGQRLWRVCHMVGAGATDEDMKKGQRVLGSIRLLVQDTRPPEKPKIDPNPKDAQPPLPARPAPDPGPTWKRQDYPEQGYSVEWPFDTWDETAMGLSGAHVREWVPRGDRRGQVKVRVRVEDQAADPGKQAEAYVQKNGGRGQIAGEVTIGGDRFVTATAASGTQETQAWFGASGSKAYSIELVIKDRESTAVAEARRIVDGFRVSKK